MAKSHTHRGLIALKNPRPVSHSAPNLITAHSKMCSTRNSRDCDLTYVTRESMIQKIPALERLFFGDWKACMELPAGAADLGAILSGGLVDARDQLRDLERDDRREAMLLWNGRGSLPHSTVTLPSSGAPQTPIA